MKPLPRKGLSVLIGVTFALWAAAFMVPTPSRVWVQAMVLVAGVEGLVSFWSLFEALHRSDRVFYGAFAAGVLVRLILVGIAAAVLVHWAPSVAWPLLTLVAAFFVQSLVQLPFLIRKPAWIS